MTIEAKLKKEFPDFKFLERTFKTQSIYGTVNIDQITKRINKDLYLFGGLNLFISTELYKGTDKSFFYAILSQDAQVRQYKKQKFVKEEFSKTFVSGKTVKQVIDKLKEKTDFAKFHLK